MNSHLEYLVEKGYIDIRTIPLSEVNNAEGLRIAKAIGVRLNSWWDELGKWLFTDDDVTKSSFAAIDMEEAKRKLENLRAAYEKAGHKLQPA